MAENQVSLLREIRDLLKERFEIDDIPFDVGPPTKVEPAIDKLLDSGFKEIEGAIKEKKGWERGREIGQIMQIVGQAFHNMKVKTGE